jgi:hypothetical protein
MKVPGFQGLPAEARSAKVGSKVPRFQGSRACPPKRRARRWVPGFLLVALLCALPAFAQEPKPLPVAVLEVRGVTGGLPDEAITAADLGVAAGTLPDRAVGGVAGLHFYPLRRQGFAFGIGGEGLFARGQADAIDVTGVPTGEQIVSQLQGLAGMISLNFGHADGWSHISAGLGPLKFKTAISPAPTLPATVDAPYALTANAGAGARWFLARHTAIGFDIRVYFTQAAAGSPGSAGRPAARLVLLSAGVTIK